MWVLLQAAGGNWPGFKQPQSQCWSGGWGRGDGLYFGSTSCGIVNVTRELFTGPSHPDAEVVLASVDLAHFGTALQSRDLTCVWAFTTLLQRDFSSVGEYSNCVKSLPDLVLGARGPRATLAQRILGSTECKARNCDRGQSAMARLRNFLCLGRHECSTASNTIDSTNIAAMADHADALSLFGNAALMDPAWHIGD
jgi:hypothetical protein